MNILVVARDRQVARGVADMRYPRDVEAIGTKDRFTTTLGDEVTVGIFGENQQGRSFDRIVVAQQKHLSEAYSNHLTFRLVGGGRFERVD